MPTQDEIMDAAAQREGNTVQSRDTSLPTLFNPTPGSSIQSDPNYGKFIEIVSRRFGTSSYAEVEWASQLAERYPGQATGFHGDSSSQAGRANPDTSSKYASIAQRDAAGNIIGYAPANANPAGENKAYVGGTFNPITGETTGGHPSEAVMAADRAAAGVVVSSGGASGPNASEFTSMSIPFVSNIGESRATPSTVVVDIAIELGMARPNFYSPTELGDLSTQSQLRAEMASQGMFGVGVPLVLRQNAAAASILERQLQGAYLTPGTRDDLFYANELRKAALNPGELSSSYHHVGRSMGVPIPANPFEYQGDIGVQIVVGAPGNAKREFSPVSMEASSFLAGGMGISQYQWETAKLGPGEAVLTPNFRPAVDYFIVATGEYGPYGQLFGGPNYQGTPSSEGLRKQEAFSLTNADLATLGILSIPGIGFGKSESVTPERTAVISDVGTGVFTPLVMAATPGSSGTEGRLIGGGRVASEATILSSGSPGIIQLGPTGLFRNAGPLPSGDSTTFGPKPSDYAYRSDPAAVILEGALFLGDTLTFGLASPGKDLLASKGQNINPALETFRTDLSGVESRRSEYQQLESRIEQQRSELDKLSSGKITSEGKFAGTPEEYAKYQEATAKLNADVKSYNQFGKDYQQVIQKGYASGAIIPSGEGYMVNPDLENPYGAFSAWQKGVGAGIQRALGQEPVTESQFIAFEQTTQFKESGPIMQFGEGAYKVIATNPAAIPAAAIQGVEIYAGFGLVNVGLGALAAPAAAESAAGAGVISRGALAAQNILNSGAFQYGLGGALVGYTALEASDFGRNPTEKTMSNLGGSAVILTAMGAGGYAPEIAVRGIGNIGSLESLSSTMAGRIPGETSIRVQTLESPVTPSGIGGARAEVPPTGFDGSAGPSGAPKVEWSFTDTTNPTGRMSRVFQSTIEDWSVVPPAAEAMASGPAAIGSGPSGVSWEFSPAIEGRGSPMKIPERAVSVDQGVINPDQILLPEITGGFPSPIRATEAPGIFNMHPDSSMTTGAISISAASRVGGISLSRTVAMDYIKARYPGQEQIWDRYLTDVQMAPLRQEMKPLESTREEIPTIKILGIEYREVIRPSDPITRIEQRMIIEQYGLTEGEIFYARNTGGSLNDVLEFRRQDSIATPLERRMVIEQFQLTADEIAYARGSGASLNDILAMREQSMVSSTMELSQPTGLRTGMRQPQTSVTEELTYSLIGNAPLVASSRDIFISTDYARRFDTTSTMATTTITDMVRNKDYSRVLDVARAEDYSRVVDTASIQMPVTMAAQDYSRVLDTAKVQDYSRTLDTRQLQTTDVVPGFAPNTPGRPTPPGPEIPPPPFGFALPSGLGGGGGGGGGPRRLLRWMEYFPVGLDISQFGVSRRNPFVVGVEQGKYRVKQSGIFGIEPVRDVTPRLPRFRRMR